MRVFRTSGLLLALAALTACGGQTTPDLTCSGLETTSIGARAAAQGTAPRVNVGPAEQAVSQAVSSVFARPGPRSAQASGPPQPVRYLALSTGGQYAAFGAGVMAGWSKNTAFPRPEFDIITGASAGGTVAPAAFAGPEFDDLLPFAMQSDVEGLAAQRPLFSLLFSNSLYDVGGLRSLVVRTNTPALRSAIAAKAAEGRKLLVGAVNLRSAGMEVFDLSTYATRADAKPDCITEAVLASAAIPALFPPRRINDTYYADAGLREHVFFRGIEDSRQSAGPQRTVEAYLIINGDLRLPPEDIDESLLTLGQRAFSIVNDQGLRQSILNALEVADSNRWRLRAISARGLDLEAACGPAEELGSSLFSTCITQTLFRHGETLGRTYSANQWLDEAALRRLVGTLQ